MLLQFTLPAKDNPIGVEMVDAVGELEKLTFDLKHKTIVADLAVWASMDAYMSKSLPVTEVQLAFARGDFRAAMKNILVAYKFIRNKLFQYYKIRYPMLTDAVLVTPPTTTTTTSTSTTSTTTSTTPAP